MNENKIRVSVVEDSNNIRESLQVLIDGSMGFECIHVYPDAETALKDMPSREIDVVLMDINLPGMDGIECTALLKDKMPHTQFMMCTVYDYEDAIFSALKAGATGYLLKRTSPAQIIEAIRELYEGGSPMSSEIARRVVEAMHMKKKPTRLVETLTAREKEVLEFLARGFLYKEIAVELFITIDTVKTHIRNIYDKLHVQTRTEALNKAYYR
jgi:DNA-binding NarL/FixJ family response regulator